jgi:hypothetical protein
MGKKITVRKAVDSDLPFIVNELKEFSKFFDTKFSLFGSEEHAHNIMKSHIDNHVLLVAENGEELLGFIAGFISAHVFNPSIKVLHETFWWVPEKHRGSRAGLLLLNEFTEIGKKVANWLVFTLEQNSPVNERCLTSRGFGLKEKQYIMEVC